MELKTMDVLFSVCKVQDFSGVNWKSEFCFTGKTDEENSLVCRIEDVPQNAIARDDGWKAFRIQGVLDFSLVGILAKISAILVENKIGIFAISTYNTDYILTKVENYPRALKALSKAGYKIVSL
ncbi:MAG: ACT domain-containing protein [Oscillospiraceae bacterium]|nr:ACT domain-containing protein [Oscillospiraceae bacterium]